ncbi:DUF502 domain-containing protein [bacterium]|nr:DUF502 domain-containing protein [bacterium]
MDIPSSAKGPGPVDWLRARFLTGIVVGAPIGITIWLVWSFVSFVDARIKPLIPASWNPETYLPIAIPGMGIVIAVVGLVLLGTLTANFAGKFLLQLGERALGRVPLVRSVYGMLKQAFETFASAEGSSFKEVVLVEFPHAGSWTIAFVTNRVPGAAVRDHLPDRIAVLVPTCPNPASGFILFVEPQKVVPLAMSVEDAAKMVVSLGVVAPHGPDRPVLQPPV